LLYATIAAASTSCGRHAGRARPDQLRHRPRGGSSADGKAASTAGDCKQFVMADKINDPEDIDYGA
jgi:hypothetical protein